MNVNDNTFGIELESAPLEDNAEETIEESTAYEQEESTPEDAGQVEEVEEVEQVPPQEEPQLILGKFKSQDDLANAYKNLQAEYTRLRQTQKAAPKEEQPQQVDEEAQVMAWYENAVQINPVQANMYLAEYMAKKQVEAYKTEIESQFKPIVKERETQHQIKSTIAKYPDFNNYMDKMTQEIEQIGFEEPDLLNSPKLWETAYFRAKLKTLEEQSKTAFENGKKAAKDAVIAKKKVVNEQSKANMDDDLPPGINIIPGGDGIFI